MGLVDVKQERLRSFFLSKGLVEYKPGCFSVENPGRNTPNNFMRYRFADMCLRKEYYMIVEHQYGPKTRRWVRMASGYYGHIDIKDGKLVGLKR